MRTSRDFAQDTDPVTLQLRGMVRRMAITLTTKALWQLAGYLLPDGTQETLTAEPFVGIGIYARPPSSTQPQAIVVMVGGAKAPAIIAVRDEATRAAVAGAIAQDETMLFNSTTCAHVTADGHVDLRAAAGAGLAQPMILGTTYRSAEDTLLTAIATYATAIAGIADPTHAATPTLVTAINVFKTAAASYLATVGRTQ